MDFIDIRCDCGLDSSSCGYWSVAGSGEHGNEPLDSMNDEIS
jgi:hypothetical protein